MSISDNIDSSDRCQTGTSGTVLQWWMLKKEIKVLNDDAGREYLKLKLLHRTQKANLDMLETSK